MNKLKETRLTTVKNILPPTCYKTPTRKANFDLFNLEYEDDNDHHYIHWNSPLRILRATVLGPSISIKELRVTTENLAS